MGSRRGWLPGKAVLLRKRERAIVPALLVILWLLPGGLFAAEVRGKVVGIRGEPLARVQVSILGSQRQTVTGDDGRFAIADVAPGDYLLQANAVGYWLINVRFSLAPGEE